MVDYSKWKDIEISDDEDETHPNIDTPSLFRWRHQARVERMEERRKEKDEHIQKKTETLRQINETRKKIGEAAPDTPDLESLKKTLADLQDQEMKLLKKEEDLKKKDKTTPWNVDTISEPGFTKTVINTKAPRPKDENLTEEEKEARMKKFIRENEKLLKEFGMLKKYDDSKQFLVDHNQLVCEETANYLVIWCINLEMEEVKDTAISSLHDTVAKLEDQLNHQAQAHMKNEFEIMGIDEFPSENLAHIAMATATKVGIDLAADDIDWMARAGQRKLNAVNSTFNTKFPRPIIVRLLRKQKRDEVYKLLNPDETSHQKTLYRQDL
ncbi:HSP90 cochaperone CDC37-like proteinue [Operophtera brumata]|uniref:HSP90 cochaperone CDC37-like proteinue n=1 Tax=Operophtera brumata TaxID=104452 RepID=A0A0L7L351_OPEBR|nr:HSP90 cochaperone CDC37-like proteinue [Operophtera brumata]